MKRSAGKRKAAGKKKKAAGGEKKKAAAAGPAAAPAVPSLPVPTMAPVLGAMIGRDHAALAEAIGGVDWERVARYLLEADPRKGLFSRFRWSFALEPLDSKAVAAARDAVAPALRGGRVRALARALRGVDWRAVSAGAPLEEVHWFGEVVELVVALYNREKIETVCPQCPYPMRDVFGRLFKMEREITGREVPLLCPFEGVRQSCPPDLAADSWTRLDDLTGQEGRAVRTDGLADRSVTGSKIAFDVSEVPEGGGRVVMREGERESIHLQHAGRVPAEPAPPDGVFIVELAGFKASDQVQIVASGFYTGEEGGIGPVVLDWDLNETNSEVSFTVRDGNGELITDEEKFVTIDWIATTR